MFCLAAFSKAPEVPCQTLILLGLRLKDLRRQRGFTQAALSEAADISYKYYQEIEGGRREDVKVSTLVKISQAMEVDVKVLFDFEEVRMKLGKLAEPKGEKGRI